jgi:hypothetical protein
MQITPHSKTRSTSTSHTYSRTSYDGLQPLQVPRLRRLGRILLQASRGKASGGIWWGDIDRMNHADLLFCRGSTGETRANLDLVEFTITIAVKINLTHAMIGF